MVRKIFFILFTVFCLQASVSPVQAAVSAPYGGTPHTIPGTIEFEDYDTGGEGVAYHDTDAANTGGTIRTTEGVDIGSTSDGAGSLYEIISAYAGEWMKYTANVETTGTYTLTVRSGLVDYASGNGEFHVEVDGVNITGTIQTYKGLHWWQGYSTRTIPNIPLTAGTRVIRLVMDKNASVGVGSFNWMHFSLTDPKPIPPPLLYPLPNPQQTFYVTTTGSDSNPGTQSQPWKTIAKAASTLGPGQTVYVRSGTYNERLVPQQSGTQNQYIIYMAYPGETVTLDGNGVAIPQSDGMINVSKKQFLRISGFTIKNVGMHTTNNYNGKWNFGIAIEKSSHVIIDNNTLSNIYSLGISTSTFSNNIIIDKNSMTLTNQGSQDDEVSLGTFWFSHDIEIKNNKVYNVKNEGIGVAAGPHDIKIHHNDVYNIAPTQGRVAVYIDGWTEHEYNIDVYSNTVHNNSGQGITVACEGGYDPAQYSDPATRGEGLLENVRIFNNVVYQSGALGGISVASWSNAGSTYTPVQNIQIINNTVYANPGGGVYINNDNASNITIRNNILYNNGGGSVVWNPSTLQSTVSYIIDTNLTANPLFIAANASPPNFRLQSGSPAINAGSPLLAPGFDFDNTIRPIGPAFDIGAFEYGTPSSPTPTSSPPAGGKPGDANGDNLVDGRDYVIWAGNYNKNVTGFLNGDFDNNSIVDGRDYVIWMGNYGT